jgi:hypothetical protein
MREKSVCEKEKRVYVRERRVCVYVREKRESVYVSDMSVCECMFSFHSLSRLRE